MLSGYAGVGKDTVADYLVKEHGYTKVSFASYLKNYCSKEYDLPLFYFEDRELKERPLSTHSNLSPRDILIKEGKTKREIDNNFFVNKLIYNVTPWDNKYVISDFRYLNEYKIFKDWFGNVKSIRILKDVLVSNSPSEHQLDDFNFDYYLKNFNTFEDLYKSVDKLLENI